MQRKTYEERSLLDLSVGGRSPERKENSTITELVIHIYDNVDYTGIYMTDIEQITRTLLQFDC
jgi:hypothetical protein